jgi:hypothetical protein
VYFTAQGVIYKTASVTLKKKKKASSLIQLFLIPSCWPQAKWNLEILQKVAARWASIVDNFLQKNDKKMD